MSYLASVSIPVVESPLIIDIAFPLVSGVVHVERFEHHVFMVAEKNPGVGALYQPLQYFNSIRVTVYNISQDIQLVLLLEIDLLYEREEVNRITMNVGHYIGHSFSFTLVIFLRSRLFAEQRSYQISYCLLP